MPVEIHDLQIEIELLPPARSSSASSRPSSAGADDPEVQRAAERLLERSLRKLVRELR